MSKPLATRRSPALKFTAGFAALGGAVALVTALTSCGTLQDLRDENPGIRMDLLQPAPGYAVTLFAKGLPKARHMVLGEQNTLFVGSMAGNVYALSLNGSQLTRQRTVITGLTDPSGVAFNKGTLVVADRSRIVRFDGIEQRLDTPGQPVTVLDGLPDKARHDAHAMAFGPDGKLYVAVGSPCNTCEPVADEFGVILRMNLVGSAREVVARGIRNAVGFDWNPQTRELWFTENGEDKLGLDKPNDELNRVRRTGEHFGFPYCHDTAIADPQFGSKRACSEFTPPAFGLGAHVAALGMKFLPNQPSGTAAMVIARHGSHPPIRVGYDVVKVSGTASGALAMTPLLTGFLQGKRYWGRPMDVLNMPDGSLLISDDLNGAIYRLARTN